MKIVIFILSIIIGIKTISYGVYEFKENKKERSRVQKHCSALEVNICQNSLMKMNRRI